MRQVYYPQGMADRDCQRCHGNPNLKVVARRQDVSLYVNEAELGASRHARVACVQCHTGVTPSTPALQHDDRESGLLHLPRRAGDPVQREHARPAGGQGQPGRARLPGLPRPARHAAARPIRTRPPSPATCRRCAPSATAPDRRRRCATRASRSHRRALQREHPRQGTARERPDRDGQLRRLPHRAPRTARPATRAPASTAPTSPRPAASATAASTNCSNERPLAGGHQDRQAAAGLQRLPLGAQHRAHGPHGLPAAHHGPVRALPPGRSRRATSRPFTARCPSWAT